MLTAKCDAVARDGAKLMMRRLTLENYCILGRVGKMGEVRINHPLTLNPKPYRTLKPEPYSCDWRADAEHFPKRAGSSGSLHSRIKVQGFRGLELRGLGV